MKYKVMCYECGNIDRFTIKEMRDLHNCQRCYEEHDTICEELANSILENENQNKRYREVIENMKSEINYALHSNKSKNVKRFYLENAVRFADKALEDEE